MDDREWAAKWVGLFYGDDGTVGDEVDEFGAILGFSYSDPEIAEAVRVKYLATMPVSTEPHPSDPWLKCVKAWGIEGPPGLFREVREAVNS